MKWQEYHNVYLAGIGGIGMSALARWFARAGCRVAGYDRSATALTRQLAEEGMTVVYEDDPGLIPEGFTAADTLVVYTPALPDTHRQLNYLRQHGYRVMKRAEVLGLISRELDTLAIAGTHGKTTTSAILAHILAQSGRDMVAFLGGIAANYDSNLVVSGRQENPLAVMEADEYDRSFLHLHPDIAVITSIDEDHLDIYGDKARLTAAFREFYGRLRRGGTCLVHSRVQEALALPGAITYGRGGEAEAVKIRLKGGQYRFDYQRGDEVLHDLSLTLPGRHNLDNALAAITAARLVGVDGRTIREALASFRGVKRRFELVYRSPRCVLVDDYAHHPAEIAAFIDGLRELFPGKELTVIFQPHLYSRTRDLASGFAQSLSQADGVVLMDIYPAREVPLPGVTSRLILDKIALEDKHLLSRQEILQMLAGRQPEVLATVGAGDIDTLVPEIKKVLTQTCSV